MLFNNIPIKREDKGRKTCGEKLRQGGNGKSALVAIFGNIKSPFKYRDFSSLSHKEHPTIAQLVERETVVLISRNL